MLSECVWCFEYRNCLASWQEIVINIDSSTFRLLFLHLLNIHDHLCRFLEQYHLNCWSTLSGAARSFRIWSWPLEASKWGSTAVWHLREICRIFNLFAMIFWLRKQRAPYCHARTWVLIHLVFTSVWREEGWYLIATHQIIWLARVAGAARGCCNKPQCSRCQILCKGWFCLCWVNF